ncbi:MAG: hypothetical protein ACRDLZ_04715 [Gaiellaceae bacterium]
MRKREPLSTGTAPTRSRSYPETIEVWQSSCPRLTVWEDALSDGLVRVERGRVLPTAAGSELLTKPPS